MGTVSVVWGAERDAAAALEHGGKGDDCHREPGAGSSDEQDRVRCGLHRNQLYGRRREFRDLVSVSVLLYCSRWPSSGIRP
jgi:hypothetical protein